MHTRFPVVCARLSAYCPANWLSSPIGEYFFKMISPCRSVNISNGSPSRIRNVLRISLGTTTLPKSSHPVKQSQKNKFPSPETRINTEFFEFPRAKTTAPPHCDIISQIPSSCIIFKWKSQHIAGSAIYPDSNKSLNFQRISMCSPSVIYTFSIAS